MVKTERGEVRCRFVIACGNATIGEVLPNDVAARIAPIASYIVATEPLGQGRADTLIRGRPAVCDNNLLLDSHFGRSPRAVRGSCKLGGCFAGGAVGANETAYGARVSATR